MSTTAPGTAPSEPATPHRLSSPPQAGEGQGGDGALRLGLRQIKGFAEADADGSSPRGEAGYPDPQALWRRSGLGRAALERLAEADAFRSVGLDRRRALWALKALGDPPLPLFAVAKTPHPDPLPVTQGGRESRKKAYPAKPAPMALLPEMPLGEHVVEDYASLGLSLKRHPLAFLRAELAREGLVTAADLARLPVDRRLVDRRDRADPAASGQRQWRRLHHHRGRDRDRQSDHLARRSSNASAAPHSAPPCLRCTGKLQREESVIHVVADRLEDMTPRLNTLRDRTGDADLRAPPKPPFAPAAKPPGYDARDIVITSRNFR